MFNQHATARTPNYILFVFVFAIVLLLVFFSVRSNLMSDIDIWSLERTSLESATMRWQKSVPCAANGYIDTNVIGISEEQVVFARGCVGGQLTALSIKTGEEIWSIHAPPVLQIVSTQDGYIFLHSGRGHYISKIDHSGNIIWQSKQFGSRSIYNLFQVEDTIYAPFIESGRKGIYIISAQTGEILQMLVKGDLWTEGDFKLTYDGEYLYLYNHQDEPVWTEKLFLVSYHASFNHVGVIGDKVYVLTDEKLNLYDAKTGDLLYDLDARSQFDRPHPLFLNNQIIIYGEKNTLTVYDLNGKVNRSFALSRLDNTGHPRTESVALSGFGNTIVILFIDLDQILLLDMPS
jgi:outer membrane protein assembly factor BamB